MDIRDLVKAIMLIIGLAYAAGQFTALRDFSIRQGIRAMTYSDYKPVHFFR